MFQPGIPQTPKPVNTWCGAHGIASMFTSSRTSPCSALISSPTIYHNHEANSSTRFLQVRLPIKPAEYRMAQVKIQFARYCCPQPLQTATVGANNTPKSTITLHPSPRATKSRLCFRGPTVLISFPVKKTHCIDIVPNGCYTGSKVPASSSP